MKQLSITTNKPKEILDITNTIEKEIEANDGETGWCFLTIAHTTAALTCADLDPGTDEDLLNAFEEMVPKLHYKHPHNPKHVGSHIMSAVIGPSLAVPVKAGKIALGSWQRIILVELDGPRKRHVMMSFMRE